MAHDHPHDIKPDPAGALQPAGCGACCGASDHAPAASASVPLGGGQRFRIPAMDCASEESEIRRAVEGIPGVLGLRFQLGELSDRERTHRFVWSVVPSLLAWPAVLLPMAGGAALLIVGFAAHLVQDLRLASRAALPAWYLPLRWRLTVTACVCLALGAVAAHG